MMLYVSRCCGADTYGVVDTDDGVEQLVTYEHICHCVCDKGLDIAGVGTYRSDNMIYIMSVIPFQPVSEKTPLQIKTEMMKHIHVTTYRNVIANIWWDVEKIITPVRIRLSNYGNYCGDYLLTGNEDAGHHKVTLVFDDKVDFGTLVFKLHDVDDTYMSRDGIGAMIDVREVTDINKVFTLYRSYFMGRRDDLYRSVIDRPERMYQIKKMVM